LTRHGKPAFRADADALLFGIQIFDSVNAEEKTLLKLVYKATAIRTSPQNPQETPPDAQTVAGANLKASDDLDSEEALVVVGFIPRHGSPYRLAVTSTLSVQEWADSERPVVLRGHTVSVPPNSAPLERTPQLLENQMVLTIVLNRSDEPAFQSFVREANDPSSPRFGQFIAQGQLAETYGPTAQAYDAVRSYLKRTDLIVIQDSPNRLTVSVSGGRELIERTFAVTIQDYRLGERTFFATKNDPSVPASVAHYIQTIVGLSSLALPHPGIVQGAAQEGPPDPNPIALATAYDFPGLGDGTGQTIGLLEYDNFKQSDLLAWLNTMKSLPTTIMGRVKVIPVAGGTTIRNPKGEGEVLLDLEIVMGMAPGAAYAVYVARDFISFHQMVNAMVNDHVTVISNSWSECESALAPKELDGLESVFAGGAASGISAFNATGDNAAICVNSNKKEVTAPADVLSAMGVGATSLLVGAANSYGVESWWPKSGFGSSAHFVAPSYIKASLGPSAKNRPVPDFVADGDEKTGILVYQADKNGWYTAGGTSMSAPLWASGIALMNQQLGPSGIVVAWVASTNCAKALHMPANMTGTNNDFSHLGFGSIDLANLVKVKPACVKQH
jgi:subtilase family serine protease